MKGGRERQVDGRGGGGGEGGGGGRGESTVYRRVSRFGCTSGKALGW